jgi:hypothetical protein
LVNDLTPDSAAVRLYAAYLEVSLERALKGLSGNEGNAKMWRDVAAEHERICSERIAAAEKAARLKAISRGDVRKGNIDG